MKLTSLSPLLLVGALLKTTFGQEKDGRVVEHGRHLCSSSVENFTLVDSEAPQTSYELFDFASDIELDYLTLPTTNLNIRVNVASCEGEPVDSVLVEWDGEESCELYTPYAVFGDKNAAEIDKGLYGNYDDKAIGLGVHTLKATPFLGPNCTGISGTPLEVQVDVDYDQWDGCPGAVVGFKLWDAATDSFVQDIYPGDVICPPAEPTIEAIAVPCGGGRIKFVRLKIQGPNDLWKRRKEYEEHYFMYGNIAGDVIPAEPAWVEGNYTVSASPWALIDGDLVEGFLLEVPFTIDCGDGRYLRSLN